MAVDVVVREAWEEDISHIAINMRDSDAREVAESGCVTPYEALAIGLENSKKVYTGLVDGEPVVMFGISDPGMLLFDHGCIWMLGTDKLEENQFAFLRRCKPYLDDLVAGYSLVENYVDARNTKTIRWLRWLGFDIITPPVPVGLNRVPFYRFEKRLEPCACH